MTKQLAWPAVAHVRRIKSTIIPLKKNTKKRGYAQHAVRSTSWMINPPAAVHSLSKI